jgi:mannose-6-phosphate isomerase-like protein (cupin superfamily)
MPFVQPLAELPRSPAFALFEGAKEGQIEVSFFVGEVPPGIGPTLHEHPYPEVFLSQEGEATFTVGEEELVVAGGHVVVVPPRTPHRLENTGEGTLHMVSIHPSGKVEQTDLS